VLQNVRFGGFGFAMNQSETDFKFNCKVKVDTEPVWTGEIDTSQCERIAFDENGGFKLFNVDLCKLFGIKTISISEGQQLDILSRCTAEFDMSMQIYRNAHRHPVSEIEG
jgi:hypothetical protein